MQSLAVIFEKPEQLALGELQIAAPTDSDAVVEMDWTGISTGTEKLLWTGRMPHFPGMGYPLVPGYESVGRVVEAGPNSGRRLGERVFVPGANCFGEVRGLFGGAASHVVVGGDRLVPLADHIAEQGVLMALAATAHRALKTANNALPELIVGHGALGRLLARLTVIAGGAPVVWEREPQRREGAAGYSVIDPQADERRDYKTICDMSGDATLIDTLIGRLARGGEIVLAGFYEQPISFAFPPAFMREARLLVAAQWHPSDLASVTHLLETGRLCLDGLITHRQPATSAKEAYSTAFGDIGCLKMILDWRTAT